VPDEETRDVGQAARGGVGKVHRGPLGTSGVIASAARG
jgi:hypothetical protein